MHGVMPLRQRPLNTQEFHTGDTQSALLKSADNLAGQPTLHGVGLDDD